MNKASLKRVTYVALFFTILLFGLKTNVVAQTQQIKSGSHIIDMGVTTQTINNAIRPYGLVYTLIRDYNVPVVWAINQSKSNRDDIDFTHNGKNYKHGPFIIPKSHRSTAVDSVINHWKTTYSGMTIDTAVSDFNVSYYRNLTYVPIWTLDDGNGGIAEGYLENAGIPSNGYNWQDPQDLDCCYDLFVMPHADPEWSTHSNLFYWNNDTADGGCGGWIWAACHAVSALENMSDASGDTVTNFLMADDSPYPAVFWGDHDDGDEVYNYKSGLGALPSLQYVDDFDPATENGSENMYIPEEKWRLTTQTDVEDPNHPDLVGRPNSMAAKLAFGRAYGDPNRGKVMYEAGHSHDGSGVANVAAQRIFFNFSLDAPEAKAPTITSSVPDVMVQTITYQLSASASGRTGPFTYEWTTACAGTFNNPYIANATFTPDSVSSATLCALTVKVTDQCGRVSFKSQDVTIYGSPQPPTALQDSVYCLPWSTVTLDPLANDIDPMDLK
ncbi:MAG: hypothetical protein HKP14_11490, partial [Bacteroidia bacterium]|nr:hypothetical protein [Bacteroidia bacterium]